MTSKQSELSISAIVYFVVMLISILAALDFIADYRAEFQHGFYGVSDDK